MTIHHPILKGNSQLDLLKSKCNGQFNWHDRIEFKGNYTSKFKGTLISTFKEHLTSKIKEHLNKSFQVHLNSQPKHTIRF